MIPATAEEFLEQGVAFWNRLRQLKAETPASWYPFESLSSLATLAQLLTPLFE